MIFSPRQYRRLKSRLRLRYKSKWKKLRTTGEIKNWIKSHTVELKDYSNFNWFFLKQLETFSVLQVTETKSADSLELSRSEEKVFDLWNQSEFADVFLKSLNRGKSVKEASDITLKSFEQHLLTMGKRQIEKIEANSRHYRLQTALGERVRKGKISPLLSTTIHLEGKDLDLMTPSLKEMKLFSQKIELALKLIRKYSPSSWDQFVSFTDSIIPIRNKEFVSYSHQDFPCVSMINLYDRDFVDLMDDLLHENGHHHLNHYLNLEKLIVEPAELIYYSPWRKTLRPLRGIYHAYFTFFWAFRLFSDLARSDLDNIWYEFSDAEREKILWRAIEEYHMLSYSFEDLKWARKKGLIADKGWEIVRAQHKELLRSRRFIPVWERKMKKHRKELLQLKTELRKNRKKYFKS